MMAFAKLAFYAAVALFAKSQFDEMGSKPTVADNAVQETALQKVPDEQTAVNPKEDYRLSTVKENTNQ